MSVHIDNLSEVDGVLVGGVWVDVDLGTLQRLSSATRSSSTGGIEFSWRSGDRVYVANAAEIHAARISPSVADPVEDLDERPEESVDEKVVDSVPEDISQSEAEGVGADEDPAEDTSLMATLKRARGARIVDAPPSDEHPDEHSDEHPDEHSDEQD